MLHCFHVIGFIQDIYLSAIVTVIVLGLFLFLNKFLNANIGAQEIVKAHSTWKRCMEVPTDAQATVAMQPGKLQLL